MRNGFLLTALSLLAGCSTSSLDIERRIVNRESLPSTYVDSPDPMQMSPPTGQRLFINWKLPKKEQEWPYLLLLKVIYKNLDEETISYTIGSKKGLKVFELLGEKFEGTGGLLTYKAEMMTLDGEVIQEFKHRLWFELISFD